MDGQRTSNDDIFNKQNSNYCGQMRKNVAIYLLNIDAAFAIAILASLPMLIPSGKASFIIRVTTEFGKFRSAIFSTIVPDSAQQYLLFRSQNLK